MTVLDASAFSLQILARISIQSENGSAWQEFAIGAKKKANVIQVVAKVQFIRESLDDNAFGVRNLMTSPLSGD